MRITNGIIKTNLVWAIERQKRQVADPNNPIKGRASFRAWIDSLLQNDIAFSEHVRSHRLLTKFDFGSEPIDLQPRVVGLLVDGQDGFVNPLKVRSTFGDWNVSRTYLPFEAGHIQDALVRLLEAAGLGLENCVPELIGFSIDEELNEYANGSSMHIAGLLAVVDAMNGFVADRLLRACAVVMPDGDNLVAVKSIDEKLNAFAREFGKATLLVCDSKYHVPESLSECFPEDVIWRVDSFGDLADRLSREQLLSAFLDEPLGQGALAEAKRRIDWFTSEKQNRKALEFAERLEKAANSSGDVGLRVQQAIELELEELNRHCGRCDKAIEHSRNAVSKLSQLGAISSFQELLDGKVRLAAALFDGHRFEEAAQLLANLEERVDNESELFTAESEVIFRNTLGRLKVVLNQDGWESLFRKSLTLQEVVDRKNIARTRCYLTHGFLRSGQLEKAECELEKLDDPNSDPFTRMFYCFYKADFERRRGNCWIDPELEKKGNHIPGYVYGFYLQATARQNRPNAEVADRLASAARNMLLNGGKHPEVNILRLFGIFLELGSEFYRGQKVELLQDLRVVEFFKQPGAEAIAQHYQGVIQDGPINQSQISLLFQHVPYF